MNESQSINATRRGGGRKPKKYNFGRICNFPKCETTLSTYNKMSTCNIHTRKNYNVRIRPPILKPIKGEKK